MLMILDERKTCSTLPSHQFIRQRLFRFYFVMILFVLSQRNEFVTILTYSAEQKRRARNNEI